MEAAEVRMMMMLIMRLVRMKIYLGKADCMKVMKAGEDLQDQSHVWVGKVVRMPWC